MFVLFCKHTNRLSKMFTVFVDSHYPLWPRLVTVQVRLLPVWERLAPVMDQCSTCLLQLQCRSDHHKGSIRTVLYYRWNSFLRNFCLYQTLNFDTLFCIEKIELFNLVTCRFVIEYFPLITIHYSETHKRYNCNFWYGSMM